MSPCGVAGRVLLVKNEDTMHHMRPNFNLHYATVGYTGATIKESGVPIDFYRTADLVELDLSRYRMIVFLQKVFLYAEGVPSPGRHPL